MSSPTASTGQVGDFWTAPSLDGKYRTGLMVHNSLAGKKVEFVPQGGDFSRQVAWYGCGPTVYDAAHMGHARTYISFDVIRRLMSEYFGYEIKMCMNITDIDDKIIKRSAEEGCDFAAFARYWETRFFDDMRALNVLLPDVVTRVSEYVPEVIAFIESIVARGFAYASEGSVYFDVGKFRASEKHVYGRMEPYSVSDAARVLEGEGELGAAAGKRATLDFALWKRAKAGEPAWPSPWGPGRPGWHIECSAMAASVLPFPLDIHSGGVDLRFPHHDNELAQSEACFDRPQWVNYFLHSGHLHIKGSKMSKSLKNFITIAECLKTFSARALRLLVLMHRWDAPMNYAPDGEGMAAASELDVRFDNFFASVRNAPCLAVAGGGAGSGGIAGSGAGSAAVAFSMDSLTGIQCEQRWGPRDVSFFAAISGAEAAVRRALCDNFDTPAMLAALRGLMSATNAYMAGSGAGGDGVVPASGAGASDVGVPRGPLVLKASRFIFKMLRICGVTQGSDERLNYAGGGGAADDAVPAGVVSELANFREAVKAGAQDMLRVAKSLLAQSDELRDTKLPAHGVLLEDAPGGGTVWKLCSPEELQKRREWREQERMRRAQTAEKAGAKSQLLSIPPNAFLRETRGDQFKEFDEAGIPTVDAAGKQVSKTQREKLLKLVEKHRAARVAAGIAEDGAGTA